MLAIHKPRDNQPTEIRLPFGHIKKMPAVKQADVQSHLVGQGFLQEYALISNITAPITAWNLCNLINLCFSGILEVKWF